MTTYSFHDAIHVLDHADGSKYSFEFLRDLYIVRNGVQRFAIPGRQAGLLPRDGYRTDFASIPGRRSLKKLLEPQRLIRAAVVDPLIKFAVWVYRKIEGAIQLIGYFVDKVAYAAVLHDWLYSTRQVPAKFADTVFFDILRGAGVWSARVMHSAVWTFGWMFYLGYPDDEVREDRELGRSAMDRFFARWPDLATAPPAYLTVSAG